MLADKLRSVSEQAPPVGDFQYIGSTSANSATSVTSLACNKPANVATGDQLVALVMSGATQAVTSTGWTSQLAANGRVVLTKLVEAGDGASYTFSQGTSATMGVSILAFRNGIFDQIGAISSSATPTVAPSITLTTSAFVIDYIGSSSATTVTTPDGWFPLLTDATAPDVEALGRFFTSGATGTVSVTLSVQARSVLISIKPTGTMAARFVAAVHGTSPYVSVYPFLENFGFGQRMTSPSPVPGGTGNGVAFTSSGDAIAIAHNTTGISTYAWSINGFGARFSDPGTLPAGTGFSVAFNAAEDTIVVGSGSSPYVSAYPWSTSGFGTIYSNPASLPSGSANGVSFSPNGAYVAVAHNNGTCLSIYPWSAGFGTKVTPGGTTLGSPCYSTSFSPDNANVAVSGNVSPYVAAYPWTGSFGTRYADPATIPTGTGDSVVFSPSGNYIAVAHTTTPFISVYDWSSGFGSKYADPASLASNGRGVEFSDTEETLFLGSASSPFINAYVWSAGFGAKYANPPTLPPAAVLDVAFCKIVL